MQLRWIFIRQHPGKLLKSAFETQTKEIAIEKLNVFSLMIWLRIRAMAVFISLMFGRLGCIMGAIFTALLLNTDCEMVFYLSGTILIRKKGIHSFQITT